MGHRRFGHGRSAELACPGHHRPRIGAPGFEAGTARICDPCPVRPDHRRQPGARQGRQGNPGGVLRIGAFFCRLRPDHRSVAMDVRYPDPVAGDQHPARADRLLRHPGNPWGPFVTLLGRDDVGHRRTAAAVDPGIPRTRRQSGALGPDRHRDRDHSRRRRQHRGLHRLRSGAPLRSPSRTIRERRTGRRRRLPRPPTTASPAAR